MDRVEESKVNDAILLHHTRDTSGRHLFEGKDSDGWREQADVLAGIAQRRFSKAAFAYALECAYIAGKLVRMDADAGVGMDEKGKP